MKISRAVFLASFATSLSSLVAYAQTDALSQAVNGEIRRVSNVCSSRPDRALQTVEAIAKAEKTIADAPIDSSAQPAVDEALKTVDDLTSSNNGYCVYKTIVSVLKSRGDSYVSDVKIVDDGNSLFFVSATNGVTLYNAGSTGDFARRALTFYLRGQADVRDGGGEARLKRACQRLDAAPKLPGYQMPDYCRELLKDPA